MDKLAAVFRDVFDQPDLEVRGLTRTNFPEWDSLAHIKLIISIEEEFDFKFSIDQVSNVKSVQELSELLGIAHTLKSK